MLSGVITRMPFVCMSIVASAFQYGCAPTLMPLTTTLISPPACVNCTIRRSAAATQSMFSVPESIAIRAPEETANHSTGTPRLSARSSAAMTRAHSGSASEPRPRVGSPSSATRSMPSGWRSVRLRISPTTMLALLVAGGRSTGTRWPSSSRSCSTNSPAGIAEPRAARRGASSLTISAGWSVPRRRAEMIRWAPSSSGWSARVGGSSTSTVTPRPVGLKIRSVRSRPSMFAWSCTISRPSPALMRAKRAMISVASCGANSIAGQA